jgi:hypothetical protein
LTLSAPIGSEVLLFAIGPDEVGDLRCVISGGVIPTPGIISYNANPYPEVECLVLIN